MLQDHLRAGFPALAITTQEPSRAMRIIQMTTPDTWRLLCWDCLQGVYDVRGQQPVSDTPDPVEAVRVLDASRDTVLLMHNLHLFCDSPELIQALQSGVERWKALGSCLVMLGPIFPPQKELQKVFTALELPLPSQEELAAMQQELSQSTGAAQDRSAVEAARGLTEAEAEAAFAMCLVRDGRFSPNVIADIKSSMLRKSGLLEAWEPAAIEEVGGLEGLKQFIGNRAVSILDAHSNLPRLRSLLLVGVPGCGKSLTCKAVASMLGWPLLRLDLGRLKGSLVGASERRMREALRIIEAFGQAVVFIDELEKGFAGSHSSGSTDGGVMATLSGTWLTWMQETQAPVLVMATANGVANLPPEMLRAGRWDGLFFVDLPTSAERREILSIMNHRYGTDVPLEAADLLARILHERPRKAFFGGVSDQIAASADQLTFCSLTEAHFGLFGPDFSIFTVFRAHFSLPPLFVLGFTYPGQSRNATSRNKFWCGHDSESSSLTRRVLRTTAAPIFNSLSRIVSHRARSSSVPLSPMRRIVCSSV